jgi:hypothetical protein
MLSKMPLWLSRRWHSTPCRHEPSTARTAATPTGRVTSKDQKSDHESEAAASAIQEASVALLNRGLAGMAGRPRRLKRRHASF